MLLGLIASGTFAGYLIGLVSAPRLSARRGPRAPTTVGGVCGLVGATTVALAPSPWILAAGAVLSGSAAGWVWAPYSDIVTEVAPRRHQPTLLAVITTGTSLGLLALAALGLLATLTSWRMTWAGIALAAAVAAVVNLRAVPLVSCALVLLGLGRTSLPLTLFSAILLGMGYIVGSSLLAIWTAQVVPDRPGDGFTVALVVGAVTSIAAPAAMGALIPVFGLPEMLVLVAAVTGVGVTGLAVRPRVRAAIARRRDRT